MISPSAVTNPPSQKLIANVHRYERGLLSGRRETLEIDRVRRLLAVSVNLNANLQTTITARPGSVVLPSGSVEANSMCSLLTAYHLVEVVYSQDHDITPSSATAVIPDRVDTEVIRLDSIYSFHLTFL